MPNYAYHLGGPPQIADMILEAVSERARRDLLDGLPESHCKTFTFERCLILAGIDISDSHDGELCSRAMQLLRRRGECRYSRRDRAWYFYLW